MSLKPNINKTVIILVAYSVEVKFI